MHLGMAQRLSKNQEYEIMCGYNALTILEKAMRDQLI